MARNWDSYSRQTLDIAHAATSLGFSIARASTRFGFSLARGVVEKATNVTSFAVDRTIFGGNTVASPVLNNAVTTAFSIAEQVTLAPIYLTESITSTSLFIAHSSINVLSTIFPGSSDPSFSLVTVVSLVRREWAQLPANSPAKRFGITQLGKGIVAWVALQGVTQEWQEKRWFKHLKEVDVKDAPKEHHHRQQKHSRVRVTSDVIFRSESGMTPQIITADIGEVLSEPERKELRRSRSRSYVSLAPSFSTLGDLPELEPVPITEVKATLRRLSKLVLAGYGGASLLILFGVGILAHGVPPTPPTNPTLQSEKKAEEATLASAVGASEAEAAGASEANVNTTSSLEQYPWWDLLLGKRDKEIVEVAMSTHVHQPEVAKESLKNLKCNLKSQAVIGDEHFMPRFWVLTDYNREQVVLVIRGTMSLNEVAADMTFESKSFTPAFTPSPTSEDEQPIPGKFTFPSGRQSSSSRRSYTVHGGMLRMAKLMGDIGKPVQVAVKQALQANPDFELVLCGHSLGAALAALIGLLWADPETCLTVPSSGLPVGRRVEVYCFGPPAVGDAALGRLASKMIVSLVYSHDVVCRLSVGSVRDIRTAAMWLCEANEEGGDGYADVTRRAWQYQAEKDSKNSEMDWFIAVRKTLEANMRHADLYPPGRVLWALREKDIHPSHRRHDSSNKLRLFEVLDVRKVFDQVVFSQDMISAHLPNQYDKVLHDLL